MEIPTIADTNLLKTAYPVLALFFCCLSLNALFKLESIPVRSGFQLSFAGLFENPLSGNWYRISPVE